MPLPDVASELPKATFRSSPEDFVVDEIPAYGPSGSGEHLLVTFRKTGRTTMDAVRALAHALEADPRGSGYAGMKDRHAITTQAATFPFPLAREVAPALERCGGLAGIEVLAAARHLNKLKPGHLLGNRFRITLRGIAPSARGDVRARLLEAGARGVPNAYGPQRFGRDGDNPVRALAWLAGRERGPRDKREQRLLFSSLQSLLFNRVLERRERDGTWSSILPGDIAKKHDSGGLFDVPLEGPELDDAVARGAAGAISPTGPMVGAKMRWPAGAPGAMEIAVLAESLGDPSCLEAFRHLGSGTRRPLRLEVGELGLSDVAEDGLTVSFVLPKGGYATTVLGRACHLVDASLSREGPREAPEEQLEGPAGSDD